MTRLVILRHAKAEKLAETDHQRPLSERGHQQSMQCAKWLGNLSYEIDCAIVSTSSRTRQTWSGLNLDCPVTFTDDAYNASAEQWVNIIAHADINCQTLLIIGHNPGLSDLAFGLGAPLELGTCCAVVIEIDGDWNHFGLHSGELIDQFEPER